MQELRGRVAAGLAAVALGAVACGGSGSTDEPADTDTAAASESPEETESEAPEAEPEAEPVELSVEELALYSGDDRVELLEACAAEESGTLDIYTSSILDQAARPLAAAFGEKYPDVQVEFFRSDSGEVAQRFVEESRANVTTADVLETTLEPTMEIQGAGLLLPFTFSEAEHYDEAALGGGYFAPSRESYRVLGWNTDLYDRDEIPTTYEELLDDKWKGVVSLAGSSGGPRWVGGLLHSHGEDFVRQFADMEWNVQNVSANALSDLVVSGEVPMSVTLADAHMEAHLEAGAPVDYVVLSPSVANTGVWSFPAQSEMPCTALLYIDHALTADGQRIYGEAGYNSAHRVVQEESGKVVDAIYLELVTDNYAEDFEEWQRLFEELFIGG